MEARKLTNEQIEELHEYCYFRQVRYYEVQIELVDHMATSIEKIWETEPEAPFVDAMFKVGEQMGGDWGFSNIVYEKEKAIRKGYRNEVWQFVGSFCTFPKIFFTILMGMAFYLMIFNLAYAHWITLFMGVILMAFVVLHNIVLLPRTIKLELPKQPLLANDATNGLFAIRSSGLWVYVFIVVTTSNHFAFHKHLLSIAFALILVFYFILFYATSIYIRRRAFECLAAQFPQFVKA